jgi:menaquinone-dependent protoporphyrinogen oxidase
MSGWQKPPHVLVAYGSKRGGTREIAEMIVEVLLDEGVDADLANAADVRDFDGYDAVVIGGALYMNRWHRDARKLVTHHDEALRRVPVWLFSSGPLDNSANAQELPPTHQVEHLMKRIVARGHVTFGGRLESDAKGFPAARMAKQMAGDRREWHKVRAWAQKLARELVDAEPHPVVLIPTPSKLHRWLSRLSF